jgi:hypothetical protein
MKLIDLDPRWLVRDGQRLGFIFKSPTNAAYYQSCMFQPTKRGLQNELFNAALNVKGKNREYAFTKVQGCKDDCRWTPTPTAAEATFENITVHPSLDGSPGGLWHGFIRNGEVT